MRLPVLYEMVTYVGEQLDRRFGWDRLPLALGILTIAGLRERLRDKNLHDTGLEDPPPDRTWDRRYLTARTIDGSYNDLDRPLMGSVGSRFGRNIPVQQTWPETLPRILEPDPRRVSRELLTRTQLIPATSLNVLAAAWIQFEVHDWLSHGKADWDRAWEIGLADDDDWPERPMRIPATRPDSTYRADSGQPPTFATADSHWWDGSQIYGSAEPYVSGVRTGTSGKLRIDPDGLLPKELEATVDLSDVAGNFWIGLGLLHSIFMQEHNAICDRLKVEFPDWTDDQLFDKARLINAALMAKVHTVEWTPAVTAHPTMEYAMRANWWGLMGEFGGPRRGPFHNSDILFGIMGSPTDHHAAPYSLTEEFVAVYRMHPLLPDEFTFRSADDDHLLAEYTFPELGALATRQRLEELSVANAFYSLGVAHPGAITLHNYPRFLQRFDRPDGTILDLAATDVLRSRERGVPRYNAFRRAFRLPAPRTFEQLTDNPVWARELRAVYGDVEDVDIMIGMYAEPLVPGFAFSETAFRVFALMASRRLKSDRFFTRDFNSRVYTQTGMDWIADNTMVTILLRHHPRLAPALHGVHNAFKPWNRVGS